VCISAALEASACRARGNGWLSLTGPAGWFCWLAFGLMDLMTRPFFFFFLCSIALGAQAGWVRLRGSKGASRADGRWLRPGQRAEIDICLRSHPSCSCSSSTFSITSHARWGEEGGSKETEKKRGARKDVGVQTLIPGFRGRKKDSHE
jgi:hypothetical protein